MKRELDEGLRGADRIEESGGSFLAEGIKWEASQGPMMSLCAK